MVAPSYSIGNIRNVANPGLTEELFLSFKIGVEVKVAEGIFLMVPFLENGGIIGNILFLDYKFKIDPFGGFCCVGLKINFVFVDLKEPIILKSNQQSFAFLCQYIRVEPAIKFNQRFG